MGFFSRKPSNSDSSSSSSDIGVTTSGGSSLGLDNSSSFSGSSSLRDVAQTEGSQQAQQLLRLMVLQTLNQQVQKTCFTKCFPGNKFYAELSRSDHLCLAKCMDRMYEAHAIVSQASAEMSQHVSPQGPGLL